MPIGRRLLDDAPGPLYPRSLLAPGRRRRGPGRRDRRLQPLRRSAAAGRTRRATLDRHRPRARPARLPDQRDRPRSVAGRVPLRLPVRARRRTPTSAAASFAAELAPRARRFTDGRRPAAGDRRSPSLAVPWRSWIAGRYDRTPSAIAVDLDAPARAARQPTSTVRRVGSAATRRSPGVPSRGRAQRSADHRWERSGPGRDRAETPDDPPLHTGARPEAAARRYTRLAGRAVSLMVEAET